MGDVTTPDVQNGQNIKPNEANFRGWIGLDRNPYHDNPRYRDPVTAVFKGAETFGMDQTLLEKRADLGMAGQLYVDLGGKNPQADATSIINTFIESNMKGIKREYGPPKHPYKGLYGITQERQKVATKLANTAFLFAWNNTPESIEALFQHGGVIDYLNKIIANPDYNPKFEKDPKQSFADLTEPENPFFQKEDFLRKLLEQSGILNTYTGSDGAIRLDSFRKSLIKAGIPENSDVFTKLIDPKLKDPHKEPISDLAKNQSWPETGDDFDPIRTAIAQGLTQVIQPAWQEGLLPVDVTQRNFFEPELIEAMSAVEPTSEQQDLLDKFEGGLKKRVTSFIENPNQTVNPMDLVYWVKNGKDYMNGVLNRALNQVPNEKRQEAEKNAQSYKEIMEGGRRFLTSLYKGLNSDFVPDDLEHGGEDMSDPQAKLDLVSQTINHFYSGILKSMLPLNLSQELLLTYVGEDDPSGLAANKIKEQFLQTAITPESDRVLA